VSEPKPVQLTPRFLEPARSDAEFVRLARTLARLSGTDAATLPALAEEVLNDFLERRGSWEPPDRWRLDAVARVIVDLVSQGWSVSVKRGVVSVVPPAEIMEDPQREKERIRRQELLKRDEQLRKPPVASFIRGVERRRLFEGRFVSIFSLMRDGRELADALRRARTDASLPAPVDPYIQVVASGERCAWTGLELLEIWRYFRHTWSNQYVSVPGRTMMLLVRDRAAEFHPIIGIAALSSAVVQLRERDEWIGWEPGTLIEHMRAHPTAALAEWLQQILDAAISELYVDDLIESRVLTARTLKAPRAADLEALKEDAEKAHKRHYGGAPQKPSDRDRGTEDYWLRRARSDLFRFKRSTMLAELLQARIVLRRAFRGQPTAAALETLLASEDGEKAVRRLIRRAKAERVGIAMADISVCGAVAPYGPLLGGKLVSMLMASPEVVLAYRARYSAAESEIASSMAGRSVVRPADLVYLGTTSLYGVGSSQYNRIKLPCSELGASGDKTLSFTELGHSESFGTSQFAAETLRSLANAFEQQNYGRQRINYIFGEGVSPKLRKVREALDALNLPSGELLQHGRRRIIYGVSLVSNLRDYLLGIDKTPRYLVSPDLGADATQKIAAWWRKRWLQMRIASDEVLADVARHTLIHPIRHGARVVLPADKAQGQLPFYAER